jgi:hypothetical protein
LSLNIKRASAFQQSLRQSATVSLRFFTTTNSRNSIVIPIDVLLPPMSSSSSPSPHLCERHVRVRWTQIFYSSSLRMRAIGISYPSMKKSNQCLLRVQKDRQFVHRVYGENRTPGLPCPPPTRSIRAGWIPVFLVRRWGCPFRIVRP